MDWDGNAYYAGDVYVQGDGATVGFDGAKKLATEEYVNAQIGSNDAVTSQANWNQNDETATDYVKNRTHWVEDIRITLMDDVTINYTSPTGHGITFDSFTEGQTYTVTWDGTDYECVAYTVTGPGVPGIGNNKFVGGGADTGEPFLFFVHSSTSYIYTSTSGTHTFSIASGGMVVHQLDAKYIPEAKNSNLVNGSASGSVRTTGSAEESGGYKMGDCAFAEGLSTIASGWYAHAEGAQTTASGDWSHAENCVTTAKGKASHAEGRYTTASGDSQHVQGKYNIEDTNDTYAHIVGNGYYDGRTATRVYSNAHTLDWNGNAWFKGSVYVGGTGQTDTAAVMVLPAKLVSTETTPTTNNTIYWLYE